jgi:hypothetical protein
MMKKTMIILVLALMATVAMQAQSLDGKWIAAEETDDVNMAYILVFEGNLMRQCGLFETEAAEVGDVTISIVVPAQSFTPGSKTLNFTFDAKEAELDVQDIDYNDKLKATVKDSPEKKEALTKIVQALFREQKEEMAENMLLKGPHTIVKLTDEQLVLRDEEGEEYVFGRNLPEE